VPHALAWLDTDNPRSPPKAISDAVAMHLAVRALFGAAGFPARVEDRELQWRRDWLGRPFVTWAGAVAAWAEERGTDCRHLHVSNTHDGGAHLVLAAYAETLVGVGIDAVHLPRLRRPGKDGAYLRQFAAKFMAAEEREAFETAAAQDDEEQLRIRVAAHFSLMEAASKACGTGLKIGAGMGRPTSLPKQSLGVHSLTPDVELLFGPEARTRLETLGATRWEGHWSADDAYLISAALLWR
jgi:phosphopantetheinyl transferase (holo-ACP synthase)